MPNILNPLVHSTRSCYFLLHSEKKNAKIFRQRIDNHLLGTVFVNRYAVKI
jgi:hypothetical protein